MKKTLVTGSTGFVGSHLTTRLVNDSWEVHVIVRENSNLQLLNDVQDKITIHVHNGTTSNMVSIIDNAKPDIVFHLATLSLLEHRTKDIVQLFNSNILFPNQLVEAMVKNEIYCLVNTGTFWQHYQSKKYSPVNLYAATKKAFEDILIYYLETTPLRIITLKLFDSYGPNDPRSKIFNQLKRAIEKSESLDMTLGEQLIDIVYISDIIEAYIISANRILNESSGKSEEFAISSGKPITLKVLVNKYLKIMGKKADINWGGTRYRSRQEMIPWNKGHTLPGWEPKITIEEGIRFMEGI